MGRESIFRGKVPDNRVQGQLTPKGQQAFDVAREQLLRLYHSVMGHKPSTVSDADTIEFLARGPAETRVYLRELRRGKP